MLKAPEQADKEYDFNFNVEIQQAIESSELAYIVLKTCKWPLKRVGAFHDQLPPDHIAKKALDVTFNIVLIYHDGKKINTNPYSMLPHW